MGCKEIKKLIEKGEILILSSEELQKMKLTPKNFQKLKEQVERLQEIILLLDCNN